VIEYVLPLRWWDDSGLDELVTYLRWLSRRVAVTVVDGSDADRFDRHARAFAGLARHVPPDADLDFANGKVNGVTTGLRIARHERVVIADDDVRYDDEALCRVADLLDTHDLVRPQNYFSPLPWHARWDTARTLLNRAAGADYPGTFGLRRSVFARMGGYDGDVLFENLELIRTVRAYGGVEARPRDLFVRRLPCDASRFWRQRVRQAYDDLAQPVRFAATLSLLPVTVAAAVAAVRHDRRWWAVPVGLAVTAVAAAEVGRRRGGGDVFPRTAALFAPLWLAERGVCEWLAVGTRLTRGGVEYAGRRLRTAAHSERHLRSGQGAR
jgi:hypothetical protein